MHLLGRYKNGNTRVTLLSDGTKERFTLDDEFRPEFAENIDLCITKKCDGGCAWCYEGCTPEGKHGDIMGAKFIDMLKPYTELAINGNDMTHPDLVPFLEKLKGQNVIANMTVNQIHFERHFDLIKKLVDEKLIYGLGISLRNPTQEFIDKVKQFPNAVIHCINGVLSEDDVNALAGNGLKLLILGYKHMRRGNDWYAAESEDIKSKQKWLYENIGKMFDQFKVVSFDNLALEQLDVKRLVSDEEWELYFMGDDGGFTFYVDLVDKKFSKNSIAPMTDRYDLLDDATEMFQYIRKQVKA